MLLNEDWWHFTEVSEQPMAQFQWSSSSRRIPGLLDPWKWDS